MFLGLDMMILSMIDPIIRRFLVCFSSWCECLVVFVILLLEGRSLFFVFWRKRSLLVLRLVVWPGCMTLDVFCLEFCFIFGSLVDWY